MNRIETAAARQTTTEPIEPLLGTPGLRSIACTPIANAAYYAAAVVNALATRSTGFDGAVTLTRSVEGDLDTMSSNDLIGAVRTAQSGL